MFRPENPEIEDFRADYANRADFCEMLERELKPLYLLAFLLTANHQKAEQCFVATVEESLKEQAVFKDWVRFWIRRSLIKSAIRIVSPASAGSRRTPDSWSSGPQSTGGDDEINAVTKLPPLQRFVFVMSVLERYSPWECAVMLGCTRQKVAQSRMQALRQLPGPVGFAPRIEKLTSRLVETPRLTPIGVFCSSADYANVPR